MPQLPQGWFSHADISAYRELVQNIPNGGLLVEVGVWKGRSLCSIADIIVAKGLTVIAVDTFKGSQNEEEHLKEVSKLDLQKIFLDNVSSFGIGESVYTISGDINDPDTFDKISKGLEIRGIQKIDLMFIDAEHTYSAVTKTINIYKDIVNVFAGHDYTDVWPEVKKAVNERFKQVKTYGDAVWSFTPKTVSIIIPTWSGGEKLDKCLDSIQGDGEIIVVNNNPNLKLVERQGVRIVDEFRKGFGHACNTGAKYATGNYLIFLNDDCEILDWGKSNWVDRLISPLEDSNVGITGVLENHWPDANFNFLVGFCIGIRRGLFSEHQFNIYEWGGCEDIELCFKVFCEGYKLLNVNPNNDYPIYHAAEGTLHDDEHKERWQNGLFQENKHKLADNLSRSIAIITPTVRPENLKVVGDSIKKALVGVESLISVKWIVVPNGGVSIPDSFIEEFPFADVIPYNQPSPHGNAARRWGLEHLHSDKFFVPTHVYYQDDDNTFSVDVLKALYIDADVVLIKQLNSDGSVKSVPRLPITQGEIDTAMIVANAQVAVEVGWNSDAYEADTHYASQLTKLVGASGSNPYYNRRIKINDRLICSYNSIVFTDPKSVTAVIPTKNRYSSTLALTLQAVITQTYRPAEILIYDDSEEPVDIREWEAYKFLLILANKLGIKWQLVYAPKLGVWASHQDSIKRASCPLIWRVDDDCIPEPTVLSNLIASINEGVSAVAGSVLHVDANPPTCPDTYTNKLDTIHIAPNAQWFKRTNIVEAEHLYSTFLYKKIDAMDFEFPPLSKVSFREETMLSLHLSKKGKLLLIPVVTWHAQASGGIRSNDSKDEMFKSDETEFYRFLKMNGFRKPNAKVYYAANGKGDAEILRSVVDEFAKAGTPIICAADNNVDVFEDYMVLDSYHSFTMGFGNVSDWNIYNFLNDRKWTKSLKEAYETFFV